MTTIGFAFRSPDVVRFMLDRSKYSVCVVPENDVVGAVAKALNEFDKVTHGNRTKVYLYKSMHALGYANKTAPTMFKSGIHVIFDTISLLKKKGIKVLDVDTKDQADWQVGKTIGLSVMKTMQGMEQGLDATTIAKLTKHEKFPEDDVNTDTMQSERDRELKNKSLMIVIQDMQSKNASVREVICGYVVLYYLGKLFVSKTRRPVDLSMCSFIEGNKYVMDSVSKKQDPNVKTKAEARLAELLAGIQIKLTKQTLTKINNCFKTAEYTTLMRAFSLIEAGMPISKACANTGASQSLVTMCARSLQHAMVEKQPEIKNKVTVYKKYIKGIRGIKTNKDEDELPATSKRRVITGKKLKAGRYSLIELLVNTGIAKPKANPSDVLMQSKTPVRVLGDYKTYMDGKKVKYDMIENKTYYIMFQGKKHKIRTTK